MPIELAETRGDIGEFEVSFAGETAKIYFYPNEMTIDWGEEVAAAGSQHARLLALISEVLHDWDIHDNGKKVPISIEGLRMLPSSLLERIIEGCRREADKRAVLVSPRQARRRPGIFGLMEAALSSPERQDRKPAKPRGPEEET